MSCDIDEATESLENELCSFTAFSHFTYVTAYSPTLPSLYLCHSSFSNPFVASPTSQIILQPFFRFFYVAGFSLTSPGEPFMKGRTSTGNLGTKVAVLLGLKRCGKFPLLNIISYFYIFNHLSLYLYDRLHRK